jgi:hypothetical protein
MDGGASSGPFRVLPESQTDFVLSWGISPWTIAGLIAIACLACIVVRRRQAR